MERGEENTFLKEAAPVPEPAPSLAARHPTTGHVAQGPGAPHESCRLHLLQIPAPHLPSLDLAAAKFPPRSSLGTGKLAAFKGSDFPARAKFECGALKWKESARQ